MKQTKKSDSSNLEVAQQKALDDCAAALQSIIELEKLAVETNQHNIGNVQDARQCLWDAMANIAIFASKGRGTARIKEILSGYGLEDWF